MGGAEHVLAPNVEPVNYTHYTRTGMVVANFLLAVSPCCFILKIMFLESNK